MDQGAITPHYGIWRRYIVKFVNDALIAERIAIETYSRLIALIGE